MGLSRHGSGNSVHSSVRMWGFEQLFGHLAKLSDLDFEGISVFKTFDVIQIH